MSFTPIYKLLRCLVLLLGVAVSSSPVAVAADRALLIGVGEYANSGHNLPGISIDLQIMHEVARRLGYADQDILQLQNAQVTRQGVTQAMQQWLVEDVAADDRVLVYYSGHGAQLKDENGDERDGYDEVLTMHDVATTDGKLTGVLRDDEFNALLANIPSERVVVVVDACCSGTAVRSHPLVQSAFGENDLVVKSFGCKSAQLDSGSGFADTESVDGLVFLAAAQDGEESLASVRGSLFTLALQQAVREHQQASASDLIEAVQNTLAFSLPKAQRFNPSLIGDTALLHDKGLFVRESSAPQPASPKLMWDSWFSLVKDSEPLEVQPSREQYVEGQALELDVEMPQDGYLNVVTVNADDQVVVLYPNAYSSDNFFTAGTVSLPEQGYAWRAGAPFGDSLVVSIVSEEPLNLYRSSHQRDTFGKSRGIFLRPETADRETLAQWVRSDASPVNSAALVLTVCAAGGC